ncbi:hypothetical protein FGG08_005852 [Glutinoglossum americanum]|uniref:Uncharacterized protein n=1 Tax=Glutinoglossum americanum TaxID=1670608 RepID=A0A9P8I2T5_9PEZI|nr:hypothetical protein FGG08_005852 [Glutinoglossum americanum]
MSTPTGLLSPPPPSRAVTSSIVSPGKRKREESNRSTSIKEIVGGEERVKFEGIMRDLLEVLKRQDTTPSILNHPLPKDQSEPTAKRQKVLEPSTNGTITSKLNFGTYASWGELVADVEAASSAILAVLQSKNSLPNGTVSHRHYPLLPDDENLTAGILAFKKTFNNIIARERMQRPPTSDLGVKNEDAADLDGTVVVNGVGGSRSASFVGGDSRPNRVVLTLYGNAPQPKQLFSSLQEPFRISPTVSNERSSLNSNLSPTTASSIEVITPLREAALPNGISTTQIVPVHPTVPDSKKKVPTLGDIFAPPATLPQLNPPKQSKYTTTRGSTVGWFNPSEPGLSSRSNRLGTYTTQPLSTGQWLTYNAIPPPQMPHETRRSKRDRSSSDAAKAQLNLEALARHSRAKEEALFRSAYSSFAPSYDDSSAIVPQEIKSRLWWERVGSKRFEQLLAEPFSEAAVDTITPTYEEAETEEQDEEELFREAVESWVPEDPPTDFKMDETREKPQDVDHRDLDEVLRDISELLETLNSHQRIRNLSLAPMSQTAVGQNRQITAMTGSPSSPSSAEMDVYGMLKSQLSILIAGLPPYAVAKLDGDRLAELNVSTKMVVEGKDYKGVMEEDETARTSAISAMTAAAGSATRITGPPVSQYPVQAQYNTARTPTTQYHQRSASNVQLPSSRSQGTQQYYQQQQTPVRPTSSNTQRDPIVTPHTPFQHPQRPSSTNSQRGSAGVTAQQSYAPQTPRPAQSHYGQNNSQQYFQQQGTPHGYQQYHSHSQSTAQTPTTGRQFPQPSQSQYQQPAALRQHFAPTQNQYVGARGSSPLKVQQPQQQQRGINSMSSQTPARQTQYFQQSSQNQYQTPSTLGASGFHTYMSAEQQALLMERQRATLAQQNQQNQQNQQQQARAAAQVNIQRHAGDATSTNRPQALQQSQQEYGGAGTQGYTGVQMANSLNQQRTANSGSTVTAGNGR